MEVISLNLVEYENLMFRRQQIEELYLLAEQFENGDLEESGFVDAVLHVL